MRFTGTLRSTFSIAVLVLTGLALAGISTGAAWSQTEGRMGDPMVVESDNTFRPIYEITITNLTRGQVFSPPIAAIHKSSVAFFQAGQPALPELALMAEDGDTGPLADLLDGLPQVYAVGRADGPVPPGQSISVLVEGRFTFRHLSVAGMLVNSNDAFFAANTVRLPYGRSQTFNYTAVAYDSGSESNNELCAFIPGPACAGAGAGVRDQTEAEGFVHVHAGIHGVGDLVAADTDWRNPVARISIRRVK